MVPNNFPINITGELFFANSIGSCITIVCMSSVTIVSGSIVMPALLHAGLSHFAGGIFLSFVHLIVLSIPHIVHIAVADFVYDFGESNAITVVSNVTILFSCLRSSSDNINACLTIS